MADLKNYIDTKAENAGSTQSGFSAINIGSRQDISGGKEVQIPVSSAFITFYWHDASANSFQLRYRKTQQTVNNTIIDFLSK